MSKSIVLVLGAVCLVLVAAGVAADTGLLADLKRIAESKGAAEETFTEDSEGYDRHTDMFYFDDKKVANEFKRSSYEAGKVTLAGQGPDLTGRTVSAALNPFAVGQRSLHGLGVSSDRWDVKNGQKMQLFGLYHGHGKSDFVVNKLRGHLLRNLANTVEGYLPILERIAQLDGQSDGDSNAVQDELRSTIEQVFRQVDTEIRDSMADNDQTAASATLAIVTDHHVITAHVGDGRVIAYDDHINMLDLTPERDSIRLFNLFGAKKQRPDDQPLFAHVDIYARVAKAEKQQSSSQAGGHDDDDEVDDYGYGDDDDDDKRTLQFLVLESGLLADKVGTYEATQTVLDSVKQFRNGPEKEQELYTSAVDKLLDKAARKVNFVQRFKFPDYLVAVVGLERNYNNIH